MIDPSFKKAAIFSVFKSGDRTVPSNYRPISLASVIIKVFERVIRKQIVTFLISNGHLNPTQHGFRGGCSCLSALLRVFDDVEVEALHGSHVFCLSSHVIRNLNWKYTLLKFHILQIF